MPSRDPTTYIAPAANSSVSIFNVSSNTVDSTTSAGRLNVNESGSEAAKNSVDDRNRTSLTEANSASRVATTSVTGGAAGAVDQKVPVDKPSYVQLGNHPHVYTLELYSEGYKSPDKKTTVSLPFVVSVEMDQPNAVTRTWTLRGTPYEEHSGFKQRMFRIRGRSGYTGAHLRRFNKLRNLLEDYAKVSSETMNAFYRANEGVRARLVLHLPWEGDTWDATVISFKYQRDTSSSRLSFVYEIVLATNGIFGRQWYTANSVARFNTASYGKDKDHTKIEHDCYYNAIESKLKAPPLVKRTISDKILQRLIDSVREIPERTIFDWYTWYRIWHLADSLKHALWDDYRSITSSDQLTLRSIFSNYYRWATDIKIQAEVLVGALFINLKKLKTEDFPANTDINSIARPVPNNGQPVISIIVPQGSYSAFDVAASYLGNRNEWLKITTLNQMIDARTKNDGTPLQPGDRLLIPAAGVGAVDQENFYGTNLMFRDGDLVTTGDDKDIALVSGLDNFYQNFRHRMLTVRGENRTYPEFGLPKLIGDSETSDLAGQVFSNVRAQVLSDHRVASINELTMTTEAGNIDVSLSIITAFREKAKAGFSYPF